MDPHRAFKGRKKIVDEDGKAGDVVHVKMSHNYIAYFLALFTSNSKGNAACVDCDTLVDEKTCQALF
jgi:hypothetical protein